MRIGKLSIDHDIMNYDHWSIDVKAACGCKIAWLGTLELTWLHGDCYQNALDESKYKKSLKKQKRSKKT